MGLGGGLALCVDWQGEVLDQPQSSGKACKGTECCIAALPAIAMSVYVCGSARWCLCGGLVPRAGATQTTSQQTALTPLPKTPAPANACCLCTHCNACARDLPNPGLRQHFALRATLHRCAHTHTSATRPSTPLSPPSQPLLGGRVRRPHGAGVPRPGCSPMRRRVAPTPPGRPALRHAEGAVSSWMPLHHPPPSPLARRHTAPGPGGGGLGLHGHELDLHRVARAPGVQCSRILVLVASLRHGRAGDGNTSGDAAAASGAGTHHHELPAAAGGARAVG